MFGNTWLYILALEKKVLKCTNAAAYEPVFMCYNRTRSSVWTKHQLLLSVPVKKLQT